MPTGAWSESLGGSSGRQLSTSASMSDSSGSSSSESGEQLSPQQLARIAQLYPELMRRFQQTGQRSPFSQVLGQMGETPGSLGRAYQFGQAADFGQPYDFGMGQFSPGQVGAYPSITTGPVWGEQQIQERVNQGRAQSEMATANQQQAISDKLAGSGYGTQSPLAQALSSNLFGQNLAQMTSGENNLRWQAAEGNAAQQLRSEQAAVERSRLLGDEDVRRRSLGSQDDLQRRSLGAQDELQRRRLAAQENLQRQQLSSDEQFRRSQLSSEDELRRKQLAVQRYGIEQEAGNQRESALLAQLGFYNRPSPYAKSKSDQKSSSKSVSMNTSKNSSFSNSSSFTPRGGNDYGTWG